MTAAFAPRWSAARALPAVSSAAKQRARGSARSRLCIVAASEPAERTAQPAVQREAYEWRGHRVSYERVGAATGAKKPPVVVVHGFGSNARHFRRLTQALAKQDYVVYCPDLLGFGDSAKPAVAYTPTLWAQLVADFTRDVVGERAVLLGNSIGRRARAEEGALPLSRPSAVPPCCWALSHAGSLTLLRDRGSPVIAQPSRGGDCARRAGRGQRPHSAERRCRCGACSGLGFSCCAEMPASCMWAGMNQRGLYKDSLLLAASAPIFWLIEWLLKQPGLARSLFDGFRSKPRVEKILREQVYRNESQVNDELVDILYQPSEDPDALGVFVEVRRQQQQPARCVRG
jgi:hypothetical protein